MSSRNSADVVIIGAGAAGLAAGRLLAESGKRVIIVEARDRIGGRILTRDARQGADHAAVPVELGAEFIHGVPPVSWSLIREAQLTTSERQGELFCFDASRLEVCDERQRAAFSVLEAMETWFENRAPGSDVSFEGYLRAADVEPASAERAAAYVESFNAADRNIVSATALVRQQRAEDKVQGDRIFHVRSGYDALPKYLAARLARAGATILLESLVRDVSWARGSVSVRGRAPNGEEFCIEAPQAIVTLPLGVLQANSVAFNPLPAKIAQQWNFLMMGRAERISLLFDRRFWSDKAPGLGFLIAPGELIPTWWTTAPESTALITGWAAGATTMARWQQAGISGPPQLTSAALTTLANIFCIAVKDLRHWLISADHHDWQTDEFSRGAYSYVGVGGLDAARLLSTPVEQTLFFAGEHTDVENQWGTVHAALASGIRAAQQLLEPTASPLW
jgi:monoamine oxidase